MDIAPDRYARNFLKWDRREAMGNPHGFFYMISLSPFWQKREGDEDTDVALPLEESTTIFKINWGDV